MVGRQHALHHKHEFAPVAMQRLQAPTKAGGKSWHAFKVLQHKTIAVREGSVLVGEYLRLIGRKTALKQFCCCPK
jgi:hypothetical protein